MPPHEGNGVKKATKWFKLVSSVVTLIVLVASTTTAMITGVLRYYGPTIFVSKIEFEKSQTAQDALIQTALNQHAALHTEFEENRKTDLKQMDKIEAAIKVLTDREQKPLPSIPGVDE